MIPASRWRRVVLGGVVASAVVVLVLGGLALPAFLPYSVPVVAVVTLWALARPGGWGPFALVLLELLVVGVSRGAPETLTDWALAAVGAAAVLATHLGLALLAAWPPRAGLPVRTARRWLAQGGSLAAGGGALALLGALGSATPVGWGPWVAAAALLAVGVVATQVGLATRRRR